MRTDPSILWVPLPRGTLQLYPSLHWCVQQSTLSLPASSSSTLAWVSGSFLWNFFLCVHGTYMNRRGVCTVFPHIAWICGSDESTLSSARRISANGLKSKCKNSISPCPGGFWIERFTLEPRLFVDLRGNLVLVQIPVKCPACLASWTPHCRNTHQQDVQNLMMIRGASVAV